MLLYLIYALYHKVACKRLISIKVLLFDVLVLLKYCWKQVTLTNVIWNDRTFHASVLLVEDPKTLSFFTGHILLWFVLHWAFFRFIWQLPFLHCYTIICYEALKHTNTRTWMLHTYINIYIHTSTYIHLNTHPHTHTHTYNYIITSIYVHTPIKFCV